MKKFWIGAVACLLALAVMVPALAETKYATGSTSAAVTFGPNVYGQRVIKSLYANTDTEGGAVKIYARGSAGKVAPAETPTNGQSVIVISNASGLFTNSDHVAYVHANGTVDKTTLSSVTSTTITFAAAITVAGATGDYVYELTQQGQILVGYDGTSPGALDGVATSGDVFVGPADSPIYLVVDGGTTTVIQATAD